MPLLSSPSLTPTGPNGRPVSSASPLLNMSSKFQVASSKQNQLLPLATCHLPLATCHLLLATCYLLLATCHLLLATCYWLLCLLHLTEFQFDRRHASENGHRHLELVLLEVHVLDRAVEILERSVNHAHLLAGGEGKLRLGLFHALLHLLHDRLGLLVRDHAA